MSKFDSFFEEAPDRKLTKNILQAAEAELQLNRSFHRRRRFFILLSPVLASVAAFFVFKMSLFRSAGDGSGEALFEQHELLSELLEDDDSIEIADDLALLEDLDYLEDDEIEG